MNYELQNRRLVRGLRKIMRMTQRQFADLVGVNRSRVSEWECGKATPSVKNRIAMANAAPYSICARYYLWGGVKAERLSIDGIG